MAPERNRRGNEEDGSSLVPEENLELYILASAKRMGLSFEELSLFTLNDFLIFIDMWIGEDAGESATTREATQEDIDMFYSVM